MADQATYYNLLGVSPDADLTTIKQAYRQKIRHLHPDRLAAERSRLQQAGDRVDLHAIERRIEESKRLTQQLNAAYAVLSDETQRAAYDRTLSQQRQARYEREIRQQRTQHAEYGRRTVKTRPHHRNQAAKKPAADAIPWAMIGGFLLVILLGSAWLSSIIGEQQIPFTTHVPRNPTAEGALSMLDLQATTNAFQTEQADLATHRARPTPLPRSAGANESLGDRMLQLGLYSTAIETYTLAIAERPEDGALYAKRGQAYAGLYQSANQETAQLALDDLDTALRLGGTQPQIYRTRGLLYYALWQSQPTADLVRRARSDLDTYQELAVQDDPAVRDALAALPDGDS